MLIPLMILFFNIYKHRVDAIIFYFLCFDFSGNCDYLQHFSGNGVLYVLFMILLTKWYVWMHWPIHYICP